MGARQLVIIISIISSKWQTPSIQFPSSKMPDFAIISTILLLFFHPTIPQMRTYFKMEKILCNFSMDHFLENTTCRAQPIDRDTVLINFYGMARKAWNNISEKEFSTRLEIISVLVSEKARNGKFLYHIRTKLIFPIPRRKINLVRM